MMEPPRKVGEVVTLSKLGKSGHFHTGHLTLRIVKVSGGPDEFMYLVESDEKRPSGHPIYLGWNRRTDLMLQGVG